MHIKLNTHQALDFLFTIGESKYISVPSLMIIIFEFVLSEYF